jgi:hypothetical protein
MASDKDSTEVYRHPASEPGYWLHPTKGIHQLAAGEEHGEFYKEHPEVFGIEWAIVFSDGWVLVRRLEQEGKWLLHFERFPRVRGILHLWAKDIIAADPEERRIGLMIFAPPDEVELPGSMGELAAVWCTAEQIREALADTPVEEQAGSEPGISDAMRLYFAYGSNMCPEQMAQRCPGAEALGLVTLAGHRFIINERGVATLRPDPQAETPGMLWRISKDDVDTLDACEAHRKYVYDKCYRSLRMLDGHSVGALLYIDHRHQTVGWCRSKYMARIVHAAEQHGLPERHVNMLRAWPLRKDLKNFNLFLNLIQAGVDGTPRIRQHRAEIVKRLELQRDALILETTGWLAPHPEPGEFELALKGAILERAHEFAETLHDAHRQRLAARFGDLSRLRAQVEDLLRDNRYLEVIRCADMAGEIAAHGIIVTAEEDRPHGQDVRFILTPDAPAIAAVWEAVAEGWLEPLPVAWEYMPVYIDAVAGVGENGDISNAVRDGLEKLRHAVRKALAGEALERMIDLQ